MAKRADIMDRLPVVFGLGEAEAAAAVGVSLTTFREMVADGRMPPARRIGVRKTYDVDELRAAYKALPREGETRGNSWADVA